MRDFEERKAEVFRRSEKRIKEREQRRKHILLTCIPMVLCIMMLGVYVLPEMRAENLPDGEIAPEFSDTNPAAETVEDCLHSLLAGTVEVSGNGISHSYSSDRDVQQILGLINDIVANPEDDYDESHRGFSVNESLVADVNEKKDESYKILVRHSDGTETKYLLAGNMLIDQSTLEKFHMDETTCFALKHALGIPD
jgi:adenosyl cobinamide kinase/adenosyl cobinamide phosphate guanylyltransferase